MGGVRLGGGGGCVVPIVSLLRHSLYPLDEVVSFAFTSTRMGTWF
jgi:hypothetical protein